MRPPLTGIENENNTGTTRQERHPMSLKRYSAFCAGSGSDKLTVIVVTQLPVFHVSRTGGSVVPTFINDRVKGRIRGSPLEAGVFEFRSSCGFTRSANIGSKGNKILQVRRSVRFYFRWRIPAAQTLILYRSFQAMIQKRNSQHFGKDRRHWLTAYGVRQLPQYTTTFPISMAFCLAAYDWVAEFLWKPPTCSGVWT
jgi:hypothetical protein